MSGTRSVCLSLWKVRRHGDGPLDATVLRQLAGPPRRADRPDGQGGGPPRVEAWLRGLSRAEVLALTAELSGGVERSKGIKGRQPAELAAAVAARADNDRPYASPHYWAAFCAGRLIRLILDKSRPAVQRSASGPSGRAGGQVRFVDSVDWTSTHAPDRLGPARRGTHPACHLMTSFSPPQSCELGVDVRPAFQTKKSRPRHRNPGASVTAFWLATRVDCFVRVRGHSQSAIQTSTGLGFIDQVQHFLFELTNPHDVHNRGH